MAYHVSMVLQVCICEMCVRGSSPSFASRSAIYIFSTIFETFISHSLGRAMPYRTHFDPKCVMSFACNIVCCYVSFRFFAYGLLFYCVLARRRLPIDLLISYRLCSFVFVVSRLLSLCLYALEAFRLWKWIVSVRCVSKHFYAFIVCVGVHETHTHKKNTSMFA